MRCKIYKADDGMWYASIWKNTGLGYMWYPIEACYTKWGAKRALKKYKKKQNNNIIQFIL